MAMLARRTPGRRRMMADINVVPYIDVMLVLVVILMVAAPFVNPSLVELPTMGRAARAPDAPLEVIVKADGRTLLRDRAPGAAAGASAGASAATEMPLDRIVETVRERQRQRPDTPVVISGDRTVHYESVTRVMDALYRAEVRRVGLAVKPAD
jgi:biopolymer transport protein TolR